MVTSPVTALEELEEGEGGVSGFTLRDTQSGHLVNLAKQTR